MDVVSLACNDCGAPISVPRSTKFLTCSYCGVQLSVKHAVDASYTEVLQQLDERTERIENEVAELRDNARIEAIDREWQIERESYMVTGKRGHRSIPTRTGSAASGVMLSIFGVIWTTIAAGIGGVVGGSFLPVFGVIFIIVGVFLSIGSFKKATDYREAEKRYQQRRRDARG